jgi:hypothetical protein
LLQRLGHEKSTVFVASSKMTIDPDNLCQLQGRSGAGGLLFLVKITINKLTGHPSTAEAV